MNMTARINVAVVALIMAFGMVLGGGAISSASGSMSGPSARGKVQRVYHPCDFNKNTRTARGNGSVEDLCLKVWTQYAYTTTNRDGSSWDAPAGPSVVVELIAESDGSLAYIKNGLRAEIQMYAKRDS